MALHVPPNLEKRIDELITHYPANRRRAAVLWLMHLLQEEFRQMGQEQVEWIAQKLGISVINVWELVRFYPMFNEKPVGKYHIKVCRTLSCELCGCGGLIGRLKKKLGIDLDQTTPDGLFTLSTFECLASCGSAPVLMINDELFERMTGDQVEKIIDGLRAGQSLQAPAMEAVPAAHALEKRLLMQRMSNPNYSGSYENYVQAGGYQALRKALDMKQESIVKEVIDSKLRGRGGAGFPCGMKWSFLDKKSGKPIYLICNADESEPGTFKDRHILHRDPHMLIEGILISCFAIGAKTAYIYIRGEFPNAAKILEREIEKARGQNLVGKNILGKAFDCEIYIHRGAGTYICGEETGLIASLEGKRAYPRIKPPFPAVIGLFGSPTVVNNVETLSNIPFIIQNGGAWYMSMGVEGSSGTRMVCVSGSIARPGYYEFEMGKITFRQLIYDVCGGMKDGKTLKGFIPGGSSMPIMTPDQLDTPIDFEAIRKAGSYAGSGGIVIIDESYNMADIAANVAQFYAHESCGQCTPCREGTLWMEKMLHRIQQGKGRPEDVDLLEEVANNIDGNTICALGEASAWPIKAFVKKYRKDFEAAVAKKKDEH